jgi:hypothetical protein
MIGTGGDKILCSKGREVGKCLFVVPNDRPIKAEDLGSKGKSLMLT